MKIILLQDVPGLGRKYDVKDVRDGYARNFLIARKLAEPATNKKIEAIKIREKQVEQLKKIDKDILEKNLRALEGLRVSIKQKANEKGHLFAGIREEDISKILKEQKHIDIPADMINIAEPIKETGEHEIKAGDKEFVFEVLAE